MKRKLFASILSLAMLFSLAACSTGSPTASEGGNPGAQQTSGGDQGSGETIALRVWGAEEDQALLKDLVEDFKAAYPDQTFDIQIGVESESKAKDDILTDITAAADVFAFACDQLPGLVAAGALLALDDNMEELRQQVPGRCEGRQQRGFHWLRNPGRRPVRLPLLRRRLLHVL